jgi:molecular chaperone DnaK (HSP70)
MPHIDHCPACNGPLRAPVGSVTADCEYCGCQVRLEDGPAAPPLAVPAGPATAECLSLATPSGSLIPLVPAGAALPATLSETLSTSQDDQPSITVKLMKGAGVKKEEDHKLLKHVFALRQGKTPRGVARVTLELRISTEGQVTVTLTEQGTDNQVVLEPASSQVAVRTG